MPVRAVRAAADFQRERAEKERREQRRGKSADASFFHRQSLSLVKEYMSNIPDFFPRVNAGGFRRGAACGILQKKERGGPR